MHERASPVAVISHLLRAVIPRAQPCLSATSTIHGRSVLSLCVSPPGCASPSACALPFLRVPVVCVFARVLFRACVSPSVRVLPSACASLFFSCVAPSRAFPHSFALAGAVSIALAASASDRAAPHRVTAGALARCRRRPRTRASLRQVESRLRGMSCCRIMNLCGHLSSAAGSIHRHPCFVCHAEIDSIFGVINTQS